MKDCVNDFEIAFQGDDHKTDLSRDNNIIPTLHKVPLCMKMIQIFFRVSIPRTVTSLWENSVYTFYRDSADFRLHSVIVRPIFPAFMHTIASTRLRNRKQTRLFPISPSTR